MSLEDIRKQVENMTKGEANNDLDTIQRRPLYTISGEIDGKTVVIDQEKDFAKVTLIEKGGEVITNTSKNGGYKWISTPWTRVVNFPSELFMDLTNKAKEKCTVSLSVKLSGYVGKDGNAYISAGANSFEILE